MAGAGQAGDIGIVVSVDDLTKEGIASAKANLNGLARDAEGAGEKGSTAFKGMGFAAKGMFHELGVGGPVARYLGHEVMDMASTLGTAGVAFGAVAIAGMVAYKVYEHLSESTKKTSEESLKAADASTNWIEAARIETKETDNLRKAKDELWQVEKDRNILNLERGIKEETKLIEEQFKKIDEVARRARTGSDTGSSGLYIMLYGKKEKREKDFEDLQLELRTNMEKLAIMKADLEIALGKDTLKRKVKESPDTPWSSAYIKQISDAIHATQELEKEKERAANTETAVNVQEMHNMEAAQAKRVEMLNRQRVYLSARTALAVETNEIERKEDKKTADEKEKQAQLELRTRDAAIQNTVAGFKLLSEQHSTNARKYFEIYKASAIAQTIISTREAAMGAYAALSKIPYVGPALGIAAAAAAILYGAAQIQAISSQSFSGGGSVSGGGSSASGSYAVNPATGIPAVNAPTQTSNQNVTINIYSPLSGQNWDEITEMQIVPALSRAAGRNVTVQAA